MQLLFLASIIALTFTGCSNVNGGDQTAPKEANAAIGIKEILPNSNYTTIHVMVALCDNKYQGIVPVPAKIGNGQDPTNNLYWGCAFGIKTYFKKSSSWQLIRQQKKDSVLMERLIFKHSTQPYYLVADAYNGQYIQQCTFQFLKSCSGQEKDTVKVVDNVIGIKGNAKLLAYIGHNGLMDFTLPNQFANSDQQQRDAIILACKSKPYFSNFLKQAGANPLVVTTGLMSPEAYSLHDALNAYISKLPAKEVSVAAAKAYAKYQHCSEKAASKLLVSGW